MRPPRISKLAPSFSKSTAWILQAFPKLLSSVLSVFKGLQRLQAQFFNFQIFRPAWNAKFLGRAAGSAERSIFRLAQILIHRNIKVQSIETVAMLMTLTASPIPSAGRRSPSEPPGIGSFRAAQCARFQLLFVEDMEHSRKCRMVRLDDIPNRPRPVCKSGDDKARIFIAASLAHRVPDLEFSCHPRSIAGASRPRTRTSRAPNFKRTHYPQTGSVSV